MTGPGVRIVPRRLHEVLCKGASRNYSAPRTSPMPTRRPIGVLGGAPPAGTAQVRFGTGGGWDRWGDAGNGFVVSISLVDRVREDYERA